MHTIEKGKDSRAEENSSRRISALFGIRKIRERRELRGSTLIILSTPGGGGVQAQQKKAQRRKAIYVSKSRGP